METVIERTLSDVLRTPNPVLEEAERHDVLIRRRGEAEDMILMEAKRARALRDTLGTFARLLHTAVQLEGVESQLTDDVNFILPWTSLLPEEERRQFITELTEMAGASADTGNYTPLALLLRDWQATANVYADPAAFKELTEPLEEAELPSLLNETAGRRRPKSASAAVTSSYRTRARNSGGTAGSIRKGGKPSTTAYTAATRTAAAKKTYPRKAAARKAAAKNAEPTSAAETKSANRARRDRAQRTASAKAPEAGSA